MGLFVLLGKFSDSLFSIGKETSFLSLSNNLVEALHQTAWCLVLCINWISAFSASVFGRSL